MRLASFALHRYGNYEAEQVCLDTNPGVVNILLAPNSAGKSVLRNAFADLLFGIHNQTPMGFRFGYPGMRVAAEIVRSDGSRFSFARRKVRGNVISDDSGEPLDQALLHGILGGRDRSLLERLFVLDTEALRAGGKALLESGGDVASALLSAAGGIRQARALKQRLERQRDELAPMRRTASRPFYVALDRLQAARRGGRSETLLPDEWFRQERQLEELIARQRASNAAAEAASAAVARLERVRRVRPALARHAEAATWLATHPTAPSLSPDLGRALSAARLEVATKADAAARIGAALVVAENEAEEVVVDTDLLAHSEQIERLAGEAGAARKARDDLPGIRGQYDHGLNRIHDLLKQLGSPLSPERANDALPKTALLARTRSLIESHAEIAASIRTSDTQIEAMAHDLTRIERRLGELPAVPETRPLAALMEIIRADGDPTIRIADAERALLESQTALNLACSHVPGWTGEAAALAAIAPLTTEIYARHEKDLAAAHAAATRAQQRYDDEKEGLERARGALAGIVHGGPIPDEATLALARSRRDDLWQLIYRRAFLGDPVPDTEERCGVPLPLAFERAMVEADTVADRRYTESELLARVAAARQAVVELERRVETAGEHRRVANERLNQTRRVWTQICASLPLGDEPVLADIQSFLTARERVIEALRRRDLTADKLAALRRRHSEWAEALGARLVHESIDLASLLALADRTLAQTRELREEQLKLEAQKTQFEEQLRLATASRSAQESKLDAWRVRWRAAMAELARPEDEEPGVTAAVLETLREIAGEHRATTALAERIDGINAVLDRFTGSVRGLVKSLPSRADTDDPFVAVRELGRALTQQRELEQRRLMLRATLDGARRDAEGAEQALVTARATLHATLDLIGAETIETAEQLLVLSADRTRFETQLHDAAAELHEIGDGFAIDALRAAADQVPPDEVPARIHAATIVGREASEAAQQIAGEASALRQHMAQEAADTTVNTAAAEQQAAIATLSRTLDEALVYHTAAVLLGRALEVVEKSGDSGLLQRLGVIFQKLTNGAYARVVTELDDDGTARLGLIQRDFPEERQSIDQLSEGTRDQLFLALRVAAIEDHLRTSEPLPFIGDDILQTFDDDRALAALRVLAELSRHTQVIVLTHHRHILELATRLPAGSMFQSRREPMPATV
jgi:uncharacterized protein YhaN